MPTMLAGPHLGLMRGGSAALAALQRRTNRTRAAWLNDVLQDTLMGAGRAGLEELRLLGALKQVVDDGWALNEELFCDIMRSCARPEDLRVLAVRRLLVSVLRKVLRLSDEDALELAQREGFPVQSYFDPECAARPLPAWAQLTVLAPPCPLPGPGAVRTTTLTARGPPHLPASSPRTASRHHKGCDGSSGGGRSPSAAGVPWMSALSWLRPRTAQPHSSQRGAASPVSRPARRRPGGVVVVGPQSRPQAGSCWLAKGTQPRTGAPPDPS